MTGIRFDGRILFLSADPGVVEAQLSGANISLATAEPLRDDVSTDEITPIPTLVHFDGEIGRYAHTGFKAGDRFPIGYDAIKRGTFSVIVAGKRYGKGSSREHSPAAEYAAGVRLVIAASFERIYRQNCDNIGLFTSTDLGLIERIQAGESIDAAEFVKGRDKLAADILSEGGLLRYGERHLHNVAPITRRDESSPKTIAQKILERHALKVDHQEWDLAPGTAGFVQAGFRFIHEIYTGMAAHMLHRQHGSQLKLRDPATILCFEDHNSYAHRSATHIRNKLLPGIRRLSEAHRAFAKQHGRRNHGYLENEEGSEGISHAMMAELYALPGEICVGTDSHTPHSGAVGCLAFGVGTTDMATAFLTGAVRVTVPESILIRLEGHRPDGLTAKDIALHLLADSRIRSGAGVGRVFELAGSVIDNLSTDERATLTNMSAELGGFTGIVAPDQETVRFIKERRGVDIALAPWMRSDQGAPYADVITIDCSAVTPMLAAPGDPGNGIALADLGRQVEISIAYGGSCTAGKRDDFDHYHAVLAWAVEQGLRVPDAVKLYLQFGTTAVRDYCVERGYLEAFEKAGAELLQPSCGACAQCGPGVSTSAGDVTVSAINRNFPGRSGPGQVWLASPPTVAASAIAGEILSFADLKARFGGRRGSGLATENLPP